MARIEVDASNARGNLRRLEFGLPAMRTEAEQESAVIVAVVARGRVPTGPAAGGHAAGSVRATGSQVVGGGSRFPYFPWLDFGGRVGRNNSVNRRFIRSGRYIWRSFADSRTRVEGVMDESLRDLPGVE